MASFDPEKDVPAGKVVWQAAKDGQQDLLQQILSAETTAKSSDVINWTHPGDGSTPLIIASACGQNGAVQVLCLKKATEINKRDKLGRTALMLSGTASVTQSLVSTPGIDLNLQATGGDVAGKTALDLAVHFNKDETRNILLALGARRGCDISGSRLYEVAKEGDLSELAALLQRHAGDAGVLNFADPMDMHNTALTNACRWGNSEAIALLAATPGVDCNAANQNGTTALMYNAFRGDTAATLLLIDSFPNLDLNAVGRGSWAQGRTALAICQKYKKAECEAVLLAAGAKLIMTVNVCVDV